MIFVGLKRYFISTISNHSLSVQLRVLTAETMEISASLNKLVVVKGQAGSTTEAVLFRSIFCKIRWEQQVLGFIQDPTFFRFLANIIWPSIISIFDSAHLGSA